VFVNRYLTVRDREVGLKHVFAGDTRVATKLMKQQAGRAAGGTPWRRTLYFTTDHLGSTTS
jgi:hypothetical protein